MAFHILVQLFDSTYQTNILKRILNTLTVIIGPLLVIILALILNLDNLFLDCLYDFYNQILILDI